ncbi:MAG: nicotinamide-nucleotide adenylyltransferase [Candidatus Heimdallarchaeota archaeon]
MRGMIVGRFQPFHKGHLNAIKYILKDVDDVIVIIAASQQSHQPTNPFTSGERYDMIHHTLIEEVKDFKRILIIPANDVQDNGLWVSHLTRLVPKFDICYTNNPLTKYLFEQAGKEVRAPPFYERKECSADHVRELMHKGDKGWKKLVPDAVVKIIEEIRGVERIQTISTTDKE